MNSTRPKQYLISALFISLLVHIALLLGLSHWGQLRVKPSDPQRLNIQFSKALDAPKQVIAQSSPAGAPPAQIKQPEDDASIENAPASSGWGMQREQKRKAAIDQKSQMESRIGFERMQRQAKVHLSIANLMGTLGQQGIQVSCDLQLSENFSKAKITCFPPALEGYIQSLLGSAQLRWDQSEETVWATCIPIQSLGGTRKTCQ